MNLRERERERDDGPRADLPSGCDASCPIQGGPPRMRRPACGEARTPSSERRRRAGSAPPSHGRERRQRPGRPVPPSDGSGGAGSTNGSGGGAVARSLPQTGAVVVPRLGVPARRLWTTARGAQGEGGAARHGEPTGKAAEPKRRAGGTEAAEEEAAAAVEELGLGEARCGADGREGRRWGCEAATTRREHSWPFVAGSTAGIPPDDVARREARELATNR